MLTRAQAAAIQHVRARAQQRRQTADGQIGALIGSDARLLNLLSSLKRSIEAHATVIVHFHPDRRGAKPGTVVESLLRVGRYQNQFESGLSSGSRSAYPGGERDVWERALFGSAYHADGVTVAERPKYGALELVRYPNGPIPRFGSCYLVLRPEVSNRCTFTFMGSEDPAAQDRIGTVDELAAVIAALLDEVAAGAHSRVPWPPFSAPTLGLDGVSIPHLLERLIVEQSKVRLDVLREPAGRVLDTLIEAQIHGSIELERDCEAVVADRSFFDTPTGANLFALSDRYRLPLHWHGGFSMKAADVPDDFRGPSMPRLAQRIAQDGMLNAAVLGVAEHTLWAHPDRWSDWAPPEDTLQHLKHLWHILVHFGAYGTG